MNISKIQKLKKLITPALISQKFVDPALNLGKYLLVLPF